MLVQLTDSGDEAGFVVPVFPPVALRLLTRCHKTQSCLVLQAPGGRGSQPTGLARLGKGPRV